MYRNTDRVVVLGEVSAKSARDVLRVPVDRIRIVNCSVSNPGISLNLNVPECNMRFLGTVGERRGSLNCYRHWPCQTLGAGGH